MNKNFAMSYSGGKDSILALYTLIKNGYIPKVLFVVNRSITQSKNFHALSRDMFDKVADSLDIPVEYLDLQPGDIYQVVYPNFIRMLKDRYDLAYCAFGDIFLKNMKKSRVDVCQEVGLEPLLPIFGWDEEHVINVLLENQFHGLVKSIDNSRVPEEFIGMEFSHELFEKLKGLDISLCGEKGEHHTFVYDGPIFNKRIMFSKGNIVKCEGYLTLELLS